jgi:hypothetical protein
MAIWDCGLPACCCQPAVAGGIIYADLWGELSTHLSQQALFTQSSLVLQAFPFPNTLGEVTLHPLSQACMFIYSSRGKWAFPPLLWRFHPTAAFTSFPVPGCQVCVAFPAFSHWFVIYNSVKHFPSPLFGTQCAPPSLLCVFFVVIAYYSGFFFSFFTWVGVGLSKGLCWSGPGLSVGVPCAA